MPDYYEIVKKPMDLATMENRCVSDLYTTPQKFVDEFALMMNNAVLYNTVRMTLSALFLFCQVTSNSFYFCSYNLLTVPYCKTKLGTRRFSAAAPRVWNSLSGELRTDYDSLRTFKNNLKTFLYRRDIT